MYSFEKLRLGQRTPKHREGLSTVQGCTAMISANNNISQSSDRFSTLTDSSQTKSGDKNSFAVKMDKILKKYKKTNDDIIRNQREAQLRTDKAAVEEETSEAARIAMAFISGDSSGADFSSADSQSSSDELSFEEISKSVKSDINQLAASEASAKTADKSSGEVAEIGEVITDPLSAISAFGTVTASAMNKVTELAATEQTPSDILEKIAQLFGQGVESSEDQKKGKSESVSTEATQTTQATDTTSEKPQSSGGIKLKDLERILNDTGFGKLNISADKTEKTTADVATGRQLPNVTFKILSDKSQATAEKAGTTESKATTAEGERSVTDTTVAKQTLAESAKAATPSKSTSESNDNESASAEGANISTSKANNLKSENNNLQFSAGNHENGSPNAEAKLNSKKLSTTDAIAQQQVSQLKSEAIAENIQKTQELKDVDIKEVATRIFDTVRNTESNSTNRLNMTLTPDSLGTLIVEVAVEGDAARISIKAETQDAAKAIEEQMPLLKEKLEAQGLKLEQAEVSHYSRNDSAGQSFSRDKERREDNQLRREFIRSSGRTDEALHEDQD